MVVNVSLGRRCGFDSPKMKGWGHSYAYAKYMSVRVHAAHVARKFDDWQGSIDNEH